VQVAQITTVSASLSSLWQKVRFRRRLKYSKMVSTLRGFRLSLLYLLELVANTHTAPLLIVFGFAVTSWKTDELNRNW